MTFFAMMVVSIAISVLSYVLMPKPKMPTQEAARDLELPTAEAGRPIPVIFGEGTVKSPNVLFYTDVNSHEYEVNA